MTDTAENGKTVRTMVFEIYDEKLPALDTRLDNLEKKMDQMLEHDLPRRVNVLWDWRNTAKGWLAAVGLLGSINFLLNLLGISTVVSQ